MRTKNLMRLPLNLHECIHLFNVFSVQLLATFLEKINLSMRKSYCIEVRVSDWWNEFSLFSCFDQFLSIARIKNVWSLPLSIWKVFCSDTQHTHEIQPLSGAHSMYEYGMCFDYKCTLLFRVDTSTNYVHCTSTVNCLILMEGSLWAIKTKTVWMQPSIHTSTIMYSSWVRRRERKINKKGRIFCLKRMRHETSSHTRRPSKVLTTIITKNCILHCSFLSFSLIFLTHEKNQ